MLLAAIGMTVISMVGPLDESPIVRISRPGGGGPEFIRQLSAAEHVSSGGIVVPSNAVGGGGAVTVVGGSDAASSEYAANAEPLGLYTEQLLRAFGYDRGSFGYTTINYPRGVFGNGGSGHWGNNGGHGSSGPSPIDPRILGALRDAAPIESRFPPVPGR